MAEPTEQDHITRITERLRKDHPAPAMRQQLYDAGGLPAYVQVLLGQEHDPAVVARVVAGVRAAEDGTSAE